ncbi:gliding motility-associated ABC transporter permease subunit GldF [Bacteroidia bacterium]|jgi:ABC-2 type transport system permease protein|nr:gliding motility-associated ABC transporter permease subunit GldF [Bacteroidia bacterium]
MLSIYKKEIRSFLSSLIAYVVIIVFLLIIGLFAWIFADGNILAQGRANLDILFFLAPWVFTFLISAITMRSFAEELKQGTYEILSTKPITDLQIILGKFFASVTLVIFALLPTFIYVYSVYQLGSPQGNLDMGAIMGSYLGLLCLGMSYVSIGLFASVITPNQIVAFILGLFLCFFFYVGFDQMSNLGVFGGLDSFVQSLGIQYHYDSISRGVVDTRDLIYFLSVVSVFLGLTSLILTSKK